MRVVLLQAVKDIGQKGQTVMVKDGYALNYLIPRGLAANPQSGSARQVNTALRKEDATRAEQADQEHALAKRWDGQTVRISSKAGQGQKLYGSVTKADIAAALNVDKVAVQLDQPIRSLGRHPVTLQFKNGASARVTVEIVAI